MITILPLFQEIFLSVFIILPTVFLASLLTERISYRNILHSSLMIDDRNWNLGIKLVSSCLIVYTFIVPYYSLEQQQRHRQQQHPSSNDGVGDYDNSDNTNNIPFIKFICLNCFRMVICCIGILIGTSLQPVAVTGGIACGKTSVSKILQEDNDDDISTTTSSSNNNTENSPLSANANDNSFTVIDLDKIAHDILDPITSGSDSAYYEIVKTFGDDILEQSDDNISNTTSGDNSRTPKHIDRQKLGAIVFPDVIKRKKLNGIVHPMVFKIMVKRVFWDNIQRKLKCLGLFQWNHNNTTTVITCVDIPLFYESGIIMKIFFPLVLVVACTPSIQLQRLIVRNPELSEQECKDRIASQMPLDMKVKQADVVIWNNDSMGMLKMKAIHAKNVIRRKVLGWSSTSGSIRLIHVNIILTLCRLLWFVYF